MSDYTPGAELKQKNRNNIYRLIHREGCVSKQTLTRELMLSLPTVTQNLVELSEKGLVCERGSFGNTGGRRARGYAIVPDARTAIGVDMNKHHFSAVVLNLQGKVLGRIRKYRNFENSDDYYKYVTAVVDELVADLKLNTDNILGMGLAMQGIISPDKQRVIYGNVLGITGVSLDQVGKYIPYPKALYHDSDMAAYAEYWARKENTRAAYISLSTNLGGTLIGVGSSDQNLYGMARMEHMTLVPDGKHCYCGQRGCADAYCSTYLLTDATPDGRLDTFFELLRKGDAHIKTVWEEYIRYLAILINNARMMFDSPVILGGYLAEYLDEHLDELKARTYPRNSFDMGRDYLELSLVREEPISVGAALQFVDEFIASV